MKLRLVIPSVLSVLLLAACDAGPWDAPYGSVIKEIETIQVSWFGCQIDPETGESTNPNCDLEQPSPPVVFPLNINVYNEDTEVPLNNVWVRVASGYQDIYLLPQEVIEAVGLPDEWTDENDDWDDIENGEVWAEFTGTWRGDYRPTFAETWTDNTGTADVWVWIQRMPVDPLSGQAKQSSIFVDIGVDFVDIELQPGA